MSSGNCLTELIIYLKYLLNSTKFYVPIIPKPKNIYSQNLI